MKKLFAVACAVALVALAACTTAPTGTEVRAIQAGCTQDAIVRPIVTGLLPLATADEVAAVKVAEGAIDVICANPSATPAANAQAAFTSALTQIATIEGALLARKEAAAAAK